MHAAIDLRNVIHQVGWVILTHSRQAKQPSPLGANIRQGNVIPNVSEGSPEDGTMPNSEMSHCVRLDVVLPDFCLMGCLVYLDLKDSLVLSSKKR